MIYKRKPIAPMYISYSVRSHFDMDMPAEEAIATGMVENYWPHTLLPKVRMHCDDFDGWVSCRLGVPSMHSRVEAPRKVVAARSRGISAQEQEKHCARMLHGREEQELRCCPMRAKMRASVMMMWRMTSDRVKQRSSYQPPAWPHRTADSRSTKTSSPFVAMTLMHFRVPWSHLCTHAPAKGC